MSRRNYLKRRWLILAAACVANLCVGSLYAWSVFANPMAAYLAQFEGGVAPNLSLAFTVASGIAPVTMISGGFINDRLGPRWVVLGGGVLFGAGMLASGFAESPGALVVAYGVGSGLGMGLVYGASVSNTVKFFPDKKGLAGGLTTASYGLSSVLVPPLANGLIETVGITETFKALGVAMGVLIAAASLVMEKCPSDFANQVLRNGPSETGAASGDMTWRQMLGKPAFYVMLAMLMCGAFSGLMVTSQASPIAQTMVGATPAQAALLVSVLALFNATGRIASGTLSDRLGAVGTLRLVFVACMGGMLVLLGAALTSLMGLMVAGVCVVGFCFGSIMGIYPGFTASQFGMRHNSVNYGIMFIGFALAGLFGPMAMNGLYAQTGTYAWAFAMAAAMGALGLGLTVVFKKKAKA